MIEGFFLDQDLFLKNKEYTNQNSLFEDFGKTLIKKGYVNDDYIKAIKERESMYPTGISTSSYAVAIPHVDAKYAKANTMYVITSKEGIEFEDAEEDRNIKAKIIFGIVIKNHDSHIDFLVQISKLIQNEEMLKKIYNADNSEAMKKILEDYLH